MVLCPFCALAGEWLIGKEEGLYMYIVYTGGPKTSRRQMLPYSCCLAQASISGCMCACLALNGSHLPPTLQPTVSQGPGGAMMGSWSSPAVPYPRQRSAQVQ